MNVLYEWQTWVVKAYIVLSEFARLRMSYCKVLNYHVVMVAMC